MCAEKAFGQEKKVKNERAIMATQGAMMLELMRGKPCRNIRAIKRDVDGRDIKQVVLKLLARECSVQGSFAAIQDRLLRKMLQEDPANAGRVP